MEYLSQLEDRHNEWLKRENDFELMEIDHSKNYISGEEEKKELMEQIDCFI